MKNNKNKLIIGRYDLLCYAAFIGYASCSLIIPISLVQIAQTLNFPLDDGGMSQAGILHMIRSSAMMIMLLICGWVAGRIGKRRSMGFSMLLSGTGILCCAFATEYWMLIPFLLLAGFGEGVCEGLLTPFVERLHVEESERYVNLAHSFWSIGIWISVLGAGKLLASGGNWRPIIFTAGALSALVGVGFLWKENPAKRYPEESQSFDIKSILNHSKAIFHTPRFYVYCFVMFIGGGIEYCLTFWASSFLQVSFKADAFTAGFGTAAIALGMFVGRLVMGYFARENHLRHILLGVTLAMIPVSLMLSLITPEYFTSRSMMFASLLLLLFLCGICVGPFWPMLQVYGVKQLRELDTTMLFIYFSAIGVPGAGFFSWLMGVLGDIFGLNGAFHMITLCLFIYAIVIILEGWIFPRKQTPQES